MCLDHRIYDYNHKRSRTYAPHTLEQWQQTLKGVIGPNALNGSQQKVRNEKLWPWVWKGMALSKLGNIGCWQPSADGYKQLLLLKSSLADLLVKMSKWFANQQRYLLALVEPSDSSNWRGRHDALFLC